VTQVRRFFAVPSPLQSTCGVTASINAFGVSSSNATT
jgi:hypothetical protein